MNTTFRKPQGSAAQAEPALYAEIDRLRAERAELVAALSGALDSQECNGYNLGAFQLIPQHVAGALLALAFVVAGFFWPYFI